MKKLSHLFAASLMLSLIAAAPANAERRTDQQGVREQLKEGKVLKFNEILDQVQPRMRGVEYLGSDYNSSAQVYVLKYIEKGRVIYIYVDARTGKIIDKR